MRLPEIEPEIFGIYSCWIYTGEIDVVSRATDAQLPGVKYDKDIPAEEQWAVFVRLTKAFALGHMLQDIHFTNTLIDEFVAFLKNTSRFRGSEAIALAWNATMPESGFMRALVDWVAVYMPASHFAKKEKKFPSGFVAEVAKACMRDRELSISQRGIAHRSRCFYHDHEGGKGKTKCCSG